MFSLFFDYFLVCCSGGCLCEELWDNLRRQEIELMRNGGQALSGEGLTERRRGGSCRVEDFGKGAWVTYCADGQERSIGSERGTSSTRSDSRGSVESSGRKVGEAYDLSR